MSKQKNIEISRMSGTWGDKKIVLPKINKKNAKKILIEKVMPYLEKSWKLVGKIDDKKSENIADKGESEEEVLKKLNDASGKYKEILLRPPVTAG